jgi:signal transduction histidine kinase
MTELSMYARYQAAVAELTRSALANTELPALMGQAVTLVAGTLAVAYSAIWRLLPDGSTLARDFGVGWPENAGVCTTVAVAPTSPIGAAVLCTTPVIIADWPSEMRFGQPPCLADHGVVSSLYVVIPGPGQPFGSLSVDVTASRMFSDEEICFLQAIANLLALAIERGQDNRLIEQRIEERTREIEQQLVAAAQKQAVMEERQRLARDLHDSVTQALYGITLHAQAAWRLLASEDLPNATDSLRTLQNTAQEALDEMRLLIFELRPPLLEQVGLAAALQARLNAVEGRANLQTKLIVDGAGDLSSVVEQALYRIAQEALNNALKHSRAQRIIVELQQMPTRVLLTICDDGVGFDPAAPGAAGGLGLRGIAERVAQLDGTLAVQSAPGVGTQLRVEIAL